MTQAAIFLALRALHVLAAAVWIGSTVFIAAQLTPAVEESGPAGGEVMGRIGRRGLNAYMALLGITTVLSGGYLLWRFTGGFSAALIATHAGAAFAIGGASGLLAGVIGGGVVGRSGAAVAAIMPLALSMPDGPDRRTQMQRVAQLRSRMKSGTKVVIGLQLTALVLMTVGHYI